ncbi:MAG: hypothetical protein AB1793_02155 [Candidatus Thermoplasmatota archaeon]
MDSDTADLLRGARADARESFYRPSGVRTCVIALLAALSMAVSVVGLLAEDPLRLVLVLGGAFGMVTAAAWFTWRSAV